MTFMSGLEFLKRVQAVNPEIVTFIITSSDSIKDTNKDMLYDSTLIEVDGIIQKPILSNDLCRMVERSSQQN
jgi:two-component SAPR family response regulator